MTFPGYILVQNQDWFRFVLDKLSALFKFLNQSQSIVK